MSISYGTSRVLEPQHVLPTSAWKLDNSRNIHLDEIRVSLKRIHLEGTSFKQIYGEANGDTEKIKQKIIDIVIRRGKLHNPVTETGGVSLGVVEEIGRAYKNRSGIKVGDKVVINASAASYPMYIDGISDVNPAFNEVEVTGYAVVPSGISVQKVPDNLSTELLMFLFDQSGTLLRLSELARGKEKILIVGNELLTNLIYGYTARMVAKDAEIVCILDSKRKTGLSGKGIDKLTKEVFNKLENKNIFQPVECVKSLKIDSTFDLSVNCAEIPGAETVNILATKPFGTVLFANLINNLNMALYITESQSKHLEIRSAEGYLSNYEELDLEMAQKLAPYFEDLESKYIKDDYQDKEFLLSKGLKGASVMEDFVCSSEIMRKILQEMMKVAKYDCNVIIFGDTGVGKEKAANLIQKTSERKMQPFIKINCGAISPSLIESELFGYEKGAFTGANSAGKKGYFELANNGIIFLDEVGELPLDMQAKLLRVIQDGEFYRVGGTKPVKSNVRILSATNRELEKDVEEGRFRRDLFYRLNVVPIRIPNLSQRPDDIPALVQYFIEMYGKRFGIRRSIENSAMDYLMHQNWPGNIRELENTIQRLMIASSDEVITMADVMRELRGSSLGETVFLKGDKDLEIDLNGALEEYERGLIKYACEKYGSTRKAAAALGISQTQLVRKKNKYEI